MNIKCTALGVAIVLAPCGSAKIAAPGTASALRDNGIIFYNRDDFDTAIECFMDALKLAPNDALGNVDLKVKEQTPDTGERQTVWRT